MNNKVTLAVTAALMSINCYAANDLSLSVNQLTLETVKATSTNKNFSDSTYSYKKLYKAEKGLENKQYVYIVQLSNSPVATYEGEIEGLSATNPRTKPNLISKAKGKNSSQRLNIDSPEVNAYSAYLEKKQASFFVSAESVLGHIPKVAQFKYSLNAVAVKLTPKQAERVAKLPGVKSVERDKVYHLDTDTGPSLIGAPNIWDGTAVSAGSELKGEGVVVAVLDTGINSDHPSFADIGGDNYDHTNPLGSGTYLGDCESNFPEMCNDKLIGVYSYPDILAAYEDSDVFPSPLPSNGEDYNGHGSHTAGTAAGNFLYDVPEVTPEFGVNQSDGEKTGFEFERISGVAPHANIIAYQVCQPGNTGDTYAGCFTTPMVSAVEDAISSGVVDVINFSISGGGFPWSGSLNDAWLSARNSGIFVAQSAGNDGPDPFTTSKHAPWITSVAAATHGRSVEYDKSITDFIGGESVPENIPGKSNSGGITASIVYAGDFENPNDTENDPAQCLEPFPEGTFSGQIVVCDRGEIARVQKAINVADGGAAGFVLANVEGGADNLANDAYVIPGIHITASYGTILRDWLASGEDHQATITTSAPQLVIDPNGVDNTAEFSSRGPNGSISTLTPSVTAPGVDIYAAYSDEQYGHDVTGNAPADYAYLSGTSMSSPHVAGAAALIKQAKPEWTPDNIRSALMMTASTDVRKEDGETAADWFDMGAGRIQVDLAIQSGLIMDESGSNYSGANPDLGGEPRELNIPSITDDNCVGTCSWTRTVTATTAGAWSVEGNSISDGLVINVSPSTFELEAGESQILTVEIDAFSAQSDVWSFGSVNLTSTTSPDLHLPVSVVASNGNLPDSLDFTAHRNQDSYLIKDLMAVEITNLQKQAYGLTKLEKFEGSLPQDSDNSDFLDDLTDGVSVTPVEISSETVRFTALTENSTSPDLDLFVVFDANEDGIPQADEVVGASATATADEYVDITMPQQGSYWVIVQNWAGSSSDEDAYTLAYGSVTSAPSTNLIVNAPSSVPQLTEFDMRVMWDLEDAKEGDYFTGALSLGTDPENQSNLGLIPVDIRRGQDDVYINAESTERLQPGDTQTFAVNVLANFTSEDREYDINVTLPEGVSLNEDSLSDGAIVEGNTISWAITQESLLGSEPTYRITNNTTDEMCVNPDFGQGGGYIDLSTFGLGFDELDGDSVSSTFNIPASFLGQLYSAVTVTDDGFVTIGDGTGTQPWVNQNMPDSESPNATIAPYWRDQVLDQANGAAVSVATAGEAYTIVEWDNMKFYGVGDEYADVADFEIVFANTATEDEPNIIFSYDNVSHELGASLPVSIGYENALGTTGSTPYYTSYAQDTFAENFETDIVSGTQICMYLEDIDSSPKQLTFEVSVSELNQGGPIQLVATSDVPNIPGTEVKASEVYEDVQVEGPPVVLIDGEAEAFLHVTEMTELKLPATIDDPNGDEVDILWKQVDGPAAIIAGNGIAHAILMAPEVESDTLIVLELSAEDSNGNKSVAIANITVTDNQPPVLTIDAPTSVDEGATITIRASATDPEGDDVTYTINGIPGSVYSTSAPGTDSTSSVTFEVTASDGLNSVTETVSVTVNDKKGGSMGWLALLLLPLTMMRRKLA